MADITGALARQKVEIHAGDVVIFHTGWGSLWIKDNAKFNAAAPGPGLAAAQYLVDHHVVMVGADTWSMEVIPNPNKDLQFPVHQLLIPRNGIYIFENLVTEELARDRGVRVRVLLRAAEAQRRHGLARQPARDPLTSL